MGKIALKIVPLLIALVWLTGCERAKKDFIKEVFKDGNEREFLIEHSNYDDWVNAKFHLKLVENDPTTHFKLMVHDKILYQVKDAKTKIIKFQDGYIFRYYFKFEHPSSDVSAQEVPHELSVYFINKFDDYKPFFFYIEHYNPNKIEFEDHCHLKLVCTEEDIKSHQATHGGGRD